tara:strand:- start:28683 stop:28967 length:285 start_codon:yes stop_codon:yes gene_type:complete
LDEGTSAKVVVEGLFLEATAGQQVPAARARIQRREADAGGRAGFSGGLAMDGGQGWSLEGAASWAVVGCDLGSEWLCLVGGLAVADSDVAGGRW